MNKLLQPVVTRGRTRRLATLLLVLLTGLLVLAVPSSADSVTGGITPVIAVKDTTCTSAHVWCDTYATQVSLYAWQQNTLNADFTVYHLESHQVVATLTRSCANTTSCTMQGPAGYVLNHGNNLCVSVVAYEYTGPYEHSASNFTCAGSGTALAPNLGGRG